MAVDSAPAISTAKDSSRKWFIDGFPKMVCSRFPLYGEMITSIRSPAANSKGVVNSIKYEVASFVITLNPNGTDDLRNSKCSPRLGNRNSEMRIPAFPLIDPTDCALDRVMIRSACRVRFVLLGEMLDSSLPQSEGAKIGSRDFGTLKSGKRVRRCSSLSI